MCFSADPIIKPTSKYPRRERSSTILVFYQYLNDLLSQLRLSFLQTSDLCFPIASTMFICILK